MPSKSRLRHHPCRIAVLSLLIPATLGLLACTTTPVARVQSAAISNTQPLTASTSIATSIASDSDLQSIDNWFLEARDLVSKDLNIDLSSINASIVEESEIRRQARHSLLGALSHDLENNDFAESLVDNMLSAQTASVLAIYSPLDKAILLHRVNLEHYLKSQQSAPSLKGSIQALLIHELIHAVDDIRFKAFDHYGVSYQEVFAKSTIVEGHAQWQTRRLCRQAGCSAGFSSLNEYMFDVDTSEDPALRYIQNRNFKNLEFVYREGERFIDQLMKRPGGDKLVTMAFERPPRDSIQIIDPGSFPDRTREARNLALSTAIKQSAKPWAAHQRGLLRRNVLAAAAFSVNPEARGPIVDFYTSKVLAAAKHEYYDRTSDLPIPVSVIALQTSDARTAKQTATLIFDSTAKTYSGLNGDLVGLHNWNTNEHTAKISDDALGNVNIRMYTASGKMVNDMIGSTYPVEVVTATSGAFVVHIDGRYQGGDDLMQFAGQLLLNLQRSR